MLRRPPTSITLTPEDVAAYEDRRARLLLEKLNPNQNTNPNDALKGGTDGRGGADAKVGIDPNDELKPLPGDRARVRGASGMGMGREERILGR
jgi:hypothetical protein